MNSLVLILVLLTRSPQQAAMRKYCLAEFTEQIRLPWANHKFLAFLPGGEYCLTLNNPRTGTFTLSGTGRRGTFSNASTQPRRDPHDPQKTLPRTTTDTDFVMQPDSLHGTFFIDGNTLSLTFIGGAWDWKDTKLTISPDGKMLSMHTRLPTGHRDIAWREEEGPRD